ncbi:DUF4374 domain-containing protein [Rhinopithecimicrobium faecis]
MNKDLGNTLLITDNISSDSLAINPHGITVPNTDFDRSVIVHKGYYYQIDAINEVFAKYKLTPKGVEKVDQLPMVNRHIENVSWLSPDTLFLITLDDKSYSYINYYIIAVNDFKIVKQGQINLPIDNPEFPIISIGFSIIKNSKLLIGYCFNKIYNTTDFTTSDYMYLAEIDTTNMQVEKILKDARSSYPGGINTVQSYSFKDSSGDFYFMSCPGVALGNNTKMPTAIFRIKDKASIIDPTYMINLSEKTGNHAYGFWFLGKDQAIIRSERKDLYTDFSDHHSTYQFEYYLINLKSQEIAKLALPYDKGTRKESVLVSNNKAYITIDDKDDNHQVWIYDILTRKISEGLKLDNQVDFIVRIDKFN